MARKKYCRDKERAITSLEVRPSKMNFVSVSLFSKLQHMAFFSVISNLKDSVFLSKLGLFSSSLTPIKVKLATVVGDLLRDI